MIQTNEPNDAMRRARERHLANLAASMGIPTPRPAPRAPLEVMTVAEIAGELAVSKMTVYRLIHTGELKGFRIGRTIRVKVSDYHAFIAAAS